MNCPRCQFELEDRAASCRNCGLLAIASLDEGCRTDIPDPTRKPSGYSWHREPPPSNFISSDSQIQEGIPKPSSHRDSVGNRSGVDIYVLEVNGTYLTCHPEVFARYRATLHEKATLSTADLNSLLNKIRVDVDLLNKAESGRQTVCSVVEAIVSRQQDFLAKGPKHLKPMMLRDIADEVEIHGSTVSRIVNKIRAHTPQGVIPLRSLFSGFLLNEHGEEISTQAIKLRVKELLMQESETKPITDERIVEWLRRENIGISRRTVAKYRKQLEILGSRQRAKRSSYGDVSEGAGNNPSHVRAENSPKVYETKSQPAKSKPRENRLQEMGERYFSEGQDAIGAEEYERAIGLFSATILCGYRKAESLYQFGRAHLEIVNHRITRISPTECRVDEDIKHHLNSAINGFSRAIKLEHDFLDAHFYLGIAYALVGDKKSAFRQKTVLEGLDPSAATRLTLSLNFILTPASSS